MILIYIPCKPVSWQSHKGYGNRSYNPRAKEINEYKKNISSQYDGLPIKDYVTLDLVFNFICPPSFSKAKVKKALAGLIFPRPDCTNVQKLVEDCLKKIVIKDDNLVVAISSRKQYSTKDEIIIKLTPIGNIC